MMQVAYLVQRLKENVWEPDVCFAKKEQADKYIAQHHSGKFNVAMIRAEGFCSKIMEGFE
jgi:hypothetical protein